MATETITEKWTRKIKGLMAMAQDAATTPEQRENLQAKINELTAKYGIDMAMAAEAGTERDELGDEIMTMEYDTLFAKLEANFLGWLVQAFGGRAVLKPLGRGQVKVHLFGFGSDLNRTKVIYQSLMLQCATAACAETLDQDEIDQEWLQGFLQAFSVRVVERIKEMEAKKRGEAGATTAGGTGRTGEMVLRTRALAVQKLVENTYPRLTSSKISTYDVAGAMAGRAAGNRADIGTTRVGNSTGVAIGG